MNNSRPAPLTQEEMKKLIEILSGNNQIKTQLEPWFFDKVFDLLNYAKQQLGFEDTKKSFVEKIRENHQPQLDEAMKKKLEGPQF